MKKMYRYRIYTEHVNPHSIRDIVSKYFDEFNTHIGTGVWQGGTEFNLTIEIITPNNRIVDVEVICHKINRLNHQECCLVVVDRVKTIFIHG